MAVYDFKCQKCEKSFTLTMSISEYEKKKRIKCPECKSTRVVRVLQPFAAHTSKKS